MVRYHDPELQRMADIATALGARMTITNFIPEVWSAQLLKHLRNTLVYAQDGVINRNYEGEVSRFGDTVHITGFEDPTVQAYTRGSTITWETLTDVGRVLTIGQSDYFAFQVDDLDKRQAMGGFVEGVTQGAAYNLAANVDTYVSGLMVAGVAAGTGTDINGKTLPDNKLGGVTIAKTYDAYDMLVNLRTKLRRANVPPQGWFVIVPPELYAIFLRDERFVRVDTSGTDSVMRNGIVGRIGGFDVIESNTVPETATAYQVVAGHPMATTFVQQIAETESVRLQDTFGDGVKGLHLYDGKVIYPQALASASVTISPTVTLAPVAETASTPVAKASRRSKGAAAEGDEK